MIKYKTVQTGPNSQLGGFHAGLEIVSYHVGIWLKVATDPTPAATKHTTTAPTNFVNLFTLLLFVLVSDLVIPIFPCVRNPLPTYGVGKGFVSNCFEYYPLPLLSTTLSRYARYRVVIVTTSFRRRSVLRRLRWWVWWGERCCLYGWEGCKWYIVSFPFRRC